MLDIVLQRDTCSAAFPAWPHRFLLHFPRVFLQEQIMTSTENILQTLQPLIQDVIAPDVRELKVRMAALEEMEFQSKALNEKLDLQFRALMSAISESKAQGEITALKAITDLHERVAVLESRLEPK